MKQGMEYRFLIAVFIILFLPALTLAEGQEKGATRSGPASQGLIGTWECTGDEAPSRLVFESASRLLYNGEPSAYALVPGVILVEEDFLPVSYPYTLKGDSLSVTFPAGFQLRCTRAGQGAGGKSATTVGPTETASKPGGVAAGRPEQTGRAGSGGEALLKGSFCSHSSTTSRLYNFDGAGNFSFGSETSAAWQSRDSLGDVDGTYLYQAGNQYNPKSGGRYTVVGDRVTLTWGNGNRESFRVNMRQNDGRITELQGEGSDSFIATGLCEENLYR